MTRCDGLPDRCRHGVDVHGLVGRHPDQWTRQSERPGLGVHPPGDRGIVLMVGTVAGMTIRVVGPTPVSLEGDLDAAIAPDLDQRTAEPHQVRLRHTGPEE